MNDFHGSFSELLISLSPSVLLCKMSGIMLVCSVVISIQDDRNKEPFIIQLTVNR